ncbi:hypothetical protein FKV68_21485 (plasmid) [Sinorhizobium mexicanum]|uniref:Uncharacterized protein n=1 Tax=Sinorhizobium mexicanum TaxID=375549 RepID=A0A859QYU9_9HYPH|nr:hypothetical protein FKV68_21485 [Sinorhizobium mexicanum]
MARIRRRGLGALLRVAHAGDGHDQIEPPANHCRGYGLALPQRVETRAEDVSGWSARSSKGRRGRNADHSKSSHFSGRCDGGRKCRVVQGPPVQCGCGTAGNDHGSSAAVGWWFLLLGRRVHRRRTDARRGLHRRSLRRSRQKRRPIGVDRTR